ncbi:MAG: TIGR04326 family surface carbohydrate biosynthesis protein [Steroidobacteraceae bacterium]
MDSLVLWDRDEDPPAQTQKLLHWRRFDPRGPASSVPGYLEEHADRLKRKYLAFIHDLGEYRVAGKRVIDHLDAGEGFSFWWMTQLAEKSPFKSPRIYDCLRLLALEEILLAHRPGALTLSSSDRALVQAISRLCRNMGIRFRMDQRSGTASGRKALRAVYGRLPSWLQGMMSLRHTLRRWPLRRVGVPRWYSGANDCFICSYFIHLDRQRCANGSFYSRHWEGLPKFLHDRGRNINWMQLFLVSEVVPDAETGIGWVKNFNRDAANQGLHTFLESYLTPRRVARALRLWFWLMGVKWRLRNIRPAFNVTGSSVWLWPVLRSDWHSSLNGPVAMSNCLNVALFDDALAAMPRQSLGLYLFENQAWEKALLRAWRRHGHGEIIGVQHATVPYWHLYYFDDPRSLRPGGSCPLPLPDGIAVNGVAAREAFAEGGYPKEKLMEVEALRYLYLYRVDGAPRESGRQRRTGPLRVLVVGDMIAASMDRVLNLLQDTAGQLPTGYEFTLKPHPGYAVDLGRFPGLTMARTTESLAKLLGDYDVALAANSTSAAVDAYVARLPVIVAVDGANLNLSPLRGRPGVSFVSSPQELTKALESAAGRLEADERSREDFFFLSPDLQRWSRALQKVGHG